MKKLKGGEILQNVIDALKESRNSFATKLRYKSSMSIYNIINDPDGKELTEDVIGRIMLHFPEVNYNYLKTGEGSILKTPAGSKLQDNIFNISRMPSIEEFMEMPARLKRIESMLEELLERGNVETEETN